MYATAGLDSLPRRKGGGSPDTNDEEPSNLEVGMKLFIDTGSVADVEEIAPWGVLSGATTNPTLLAKEDADPGETIQRICELIDGPVSVEVVSKTAPEMVAEGRAPPQSTGMSW
jgi:Transaldolase/Fructose-6-phosphate aldolase